LLLFAPAGWIHGRRALQAALNSDFDTVFVDWHDPKIHSSSKYKFIKLPRTGYSKFRRVMPEAKAVQLKDQILALWFKRLWKRVAPDVVHVCWIDFRAALCARAGMTPLILSAWGSDINELLGLEADPVRRACAIEALSGAALTIVDAPMMTARCEVLTGRHAPSVLLHLGVDTDQFRGGLCSERFKLRAQLGISDDDVLLSSMRGLSSLYNHDLILDAFVSSLPKLRRRAYLLFKAFNGPSSYLEMLRCKTREYGITDRVRFIDEMQHAALPSLYAATDLVINFPQRDSFPVTLLEAAACQRGVICNRLETYVGLIPDENITWVPTNDTVALAASITDKVNNYHYREDIFLKVCAAVIDGFSNLHYEEQLGTIYRKLAAPKKLGL
jgi:glycosyltransferase involved in cell wall biosynthesis